MLSTQGGKLTNDSITLKCRLDLLSAFITHHSTHSLLLVAFNPVFLADEHQRDGSGDDDNQSAVEEAIEKVA